MSMGGGEGLKANFLLKISNGALLENIARQKFLEPFF
jgi:hypothetical protein